MIFIVHSHAGPPKAPTALCIRNNVSPATGRTEYISLPVLCLRGTWLREFLLSRLPRMLVWSAALARARRILVELRFFYNLKNMLEMMHWAFNYHDGLTCSNNFRCFVHTHARCLSHTPTLRLLSRPQTCLPRARLLRSRS
jgi:hypothetical protein